MRHCEHHQTTHSSEGRNFHRTKTVMSIHTVPVSDEREHALTLDCWCEPSVDWLNPDSGMPWESGLGPLVLHNAADCREVAEELDGQSIEPGKGWKIFHDDGSPVEPA